MRMYNSNAYTVINNICHNKLYIPSYKLCVFARVFRFNVIGLYSFSLGNTGVTLRVKLTCCLRRHEKIPQHRDLLEVASSLGRDVGVSKNRDTPKWMDYNGEPY